MTYAIRHRLDEHSLLPFHSTWSGFARGREHCERVVAVHAYDVKTVAGAAGCYTIAGILVDDRGGDDEAVISTEPDTRPS